MTNTLDGFCRDLLDDESFQEALDPERLAAPLRALLRTLGPSRPG